jgi:hypothetical protein
MLLGRLPDPPQRIGVEYDGRGGRRTKVFDDLFAARRFYAAKLKQGKNPRVRRAER